MSTYVWMRILESAPRRYDLGIRLLTLGRAGKAYGRLASRIRPGQQVLDLGCGTGALALRAARRGATVKGIDVNPAMLEIASERARAGGLAPNVRFVEMGVAELDGELAAGYDVATCGLLLSELDENELVYALRHVARILRPEGLLLVADEVRARNRVARFGQWLIRAPLVVLTFALTQQTTHPVANLAARLEDAGFSVVSSRSSAWSTFQEIVAQKPGAP